MKITDSGNFVVGCNYWASHAGTAMWRDWNEASIRHDFELMGSVGLQLVRVFPLWPNFQPLEQHRTVMGFNHSVVAAGTLPTALLTVPVHAGTAHLHGTFQCR